MGNLKDINYGIGKYLELSDASTIPDIGTNRKNLDLLNFKVATNNAYSLYNFKDGIIDAYQDSTGVDDSASTNEQRNSSGKYYQGIIAGAGNSASGILNTYGAYASNTFLTSSTFDAGTAGATVDILLVGGGGSGGNGMAGGGGAGQVRTLTSQSIAAGEHTVTVALGGPTNSAPPFDVGVNGGITSFASLPTAIGGGGGGSYSGLSGLDGASGGGGGGREGNGVNNVPGGSGSAGNPGGYGTMRQGGQYGGQGGGGGAGGSGGNGTQVGVGAAGGVGVTNDYRTGSAIYYGGGGGGADYSAFAGGAGGNGGGGRGPTGGGLRDNTPGTANTGGGGGGSYYYAELNEGGSGIVVVRYTADSLTVDTPANLTLVSNAQTAQAAPTEGRLMIFEETSTGSTTLDTDLKGYVSRDNGTTYTQTPLTLDTTYETGKTLVSGSIDISGQPSGTNMKYKIETLNQSASKVCRLHGASLLWA